jgi:hypothetical protein
MVIHNLPKIVSPLASRRGGFAGTEIGNSTAWKIREPRNAAELL